MSGEGQARAGSREARLRQPVARDVLRSVAEQYGVCVAGGVAPYGYHDGADLVCGGAVRGDAGG